MARLSFRPHADPRDSTEQSLQPVAEIANPLDFHSVPIPAQAQELRRIENISRFLKRCLRLKGHAFP
jgi:hypothetical protein